jgi:hypothetical protein
MKITMIVMCLTLMAGPAWADNSVEPVPSGESDGYVAPSKDVPLYVPLTDEQQELPTVEADPGVDYVPGIEKPAGGTGPKEITDQVPQ